MKALPEDGDGSGVAKVMSGTYRVGDGVFLSI